MASFGKASGSLALFSYRDPNIEETLEIYANVGRELEAAAREMTQEELELAVIGTIGGMDSPQGPASKGLTSLMQWLAGETAEARQAWRDEVLSTTADDLAAFGRRIDAKLGAGSPTARVAVVGSKAAFEAGDFAYTVFGEGAQVAAEVTADMAQ